MRRGYHTPWGFNVDAHRRRRLRDARAKGTHTYGEWLEMRDAYGRCLKCGNREAVLVEDHIKAVSKGGSDSIQNIQPLCHPCNTSKNAREQVDYRLGQPETMPKWLPQEVV